MKKLLLAVAVLFATSMFAQFDQIQQAECDDCDFKKKTADLKFMPHNLSEIDQIGINNQANVYQTGIGNVSSIDQDGKNVGIGGLDNRAMVYQKGVHNNSDIKQHGDRNWGRVIQIGKLNYAKQDVGVGYAEDNKAFVFQMGKRNTSFQKQRFDNNKAFVSQLGRDNYAEQDQRSKRDGVAGSYAGIIQIGIENSAKQVQRGSNNVAGIFQWGYLNSAKQVQKSAAGAPFMANLSLIAQFGHGNEYCLSQESEIGAWNASFASQFGYMNKAHVTQYAMVKGNVSKIYQKGMNNEACVDQTSTYLRP